jgi:hypothetical protein
MSFSQYLEQKLLDYAFGDQAWTPPATVYVGLILQCGTLSSALTAGSSYGSIACATNTVAYAVAAGDILIIGEGSTVQVVEASAAAAVGATSVSTDTFVANAGYATGTPFIRADVYATAQEPTGGAYARVAVTNNTTNWPTAVRVSNQPGFQMQNGTTITFPTSTASWGTIAGFLIADNATPGSGNVLAYGALTSPTVVASSDIPSFAVNTLTVSLI